jgi:hypothetical protein
MGVAAHKFDPRFVFGPGWIELGRLEAELFAHFFANAAKVVGIEQDFGRVELFTDDGKVLGDTWDASLFGAFL